MRTGVRLGIDVGTVRVGVAACDPSGLIASPVETVQRGRGDLDRLATLCRNREAMEVIVGLPRSLSGSEGPAAVAARQFAAALAPRIAPVGVRMVDERLSTVSALRNMRASGVSEKRGRSAIDQAAAVIILQNALDTERATGKPPGEISQVES